MEEFNNYMKEFKQNSLDEKKRISLDQLKIVASLANTMCNELGIDNNVIVTKDIVEAKEKNITEDDYVEAVVVYTSSIQNSLCDFVDKITEILENKK